MDNDIAIKIENLSKIYKIYDKPTDRVKEALHPLRKRYSRDFYALQNIFLSIKKGETVGFIGKNGAGKSTLLKIITGVLTPTSGTVEVDGRIASLLELGAGFNPEMTGIENIYMNGMIMGCSRGEIDKKLDDIICFADIGDFIKLPVKTYSSGMFARVAFAVNAFVAPDILIVDEALSVGDMFFQSKCIDKMKHMMDDGVTVLFVSHDIGAVRSLCQHGVFMADGKIVFAGTAAESVEKYFIAKVKNDQNIIEKSIPVKKETSRQKPAINLPDIFNDNTIFSQNALYQRIQNGKAEFYNIKLLDMSGQTIQNVEYGQKVCLQLGIIANEDIPKIGFAYHIRSRTGVEIVYSDSNLDGQTVFKMKRNEKYILNWKFIVTLQAGTYNIACGMSVPENLEMQKVIFCDFVPCAVQFSVSTLPEANLYGLVHWKNDMNLEQYIP